ncbi:MAG: hypothetical protein WCY16_12385 [Weeksellaceae bacterium]
MYGFRKMKGLKKKLTQNEMVDLLKWYSCVIAEFFNGKKVFFSFV